MTIFYHFDGGYVFHVGNWPRYIGYNKRDAIRKFRDQYGLKRKRINFVDINEGPSLSDLLKTAGGTALIHSAVAAK